MFNIISPKYYCRLNFGALLVYYLLHAFLKAVGKRNPVINPEVSKEAKKLVVA